MAKKDEKAPPKDEHDPEEHDEEEDEDEESEEEESDEEESDDEESDEEESDDEDEDEDEEDDEEDEDDEDEDEHHARGVVAPTDDGHSSHEEDPTWWLPHAVLVGLVLIGVFGFFGAFTSVLGPPLTRLGLIRPAESAPASASAVAAPAQQPPKPAAPTPRPAQPQMPQRPAADQGEQLGAKHLVVQYKGSTRSTQTRSKEEAQKRAAEAVKKLKGGAKWDDIVGQYSDEPNAAERHGDLGKFSPAQMDPQFTEAVRKLKVGDTSDVVETQFGFHVIVRTF